MTHIETAAAHRAAAKAHEDAAVAHEAAAITHSETTYLTTLRASNAAAWASFRATA